MVSLASVHKRFEVPLKVIEGGSGVFHGVISEAEQSAQPTYIFTAPRHVLRVSEPNAARLGLVVELESGARYLLGHNGPSDSWRGTLWKSFRLFEVTQQAIWTRRVKIQDLVTRLERDSHIETLGSPWCAIEPLDREAVDRKLHASIEQARFITGAQVRADDLLDGRPIVRSEVQLGVRIGVIN